MSIPHPEPHAAGCSTLTGTPVMPGGPGDPSSPFSPSWPFSPCSPSGPGSPLSPWIGGGGRRKTEKENIKNQVIKGLKNLRQPVSCRHAFGTGVILTRAFPAGTCLVFATNGETEAELSQASWPQVGTANLQLAPSPGKRGPKGGVLVGKESVARTP